MNPVLSVALWILGKVIQHILSKYSQMTPEQKAEFYKQLDTVPAKDPDQITNPLGIEP